MPLVPAAFVHQRFEKLQLRSDGPSLSSSRVTHVHFFVQDRKGAARRETIHP